MDIGLKCQLVLQITVTKHRDPWVQGKRSVDKVTHDIGFRSLGDFVVGHFQMSIYAQLALFCEVYVQ